MAYPSVYLVPYQAKRRSGARRLQVELAEKGFGGDITTTGKSMVKKKAMY